ncbi:MAG: T9SS type A sorting domain-containing protein [candidate division WOR-3 bacterium]|nr:MAG: T9SS type A sorting domain-containing protein [candidate division WOR-3 bacterium]
MTIHRRHLAVLCVVVLAPALGYGAVKVDTVGTTSLDLQSYGPVWQRVFNLPGAGIYVTWVKSGMFFNYLDYSTGRWLGETEVFADANVSGNLDVCTAHGSRFHRSAFISSRTRRPAMPVVGIESVPGSGSFHSRPGGTALLERVQPAIALSANGWIHMLCADGNHGDTALYSRSTDDGLTWAVPVSVCGGSLPQDPTFNLTASKSSDKVAVLWSREGAASLWYNLSTDGGSTWSGPQDLFPLPSSIEGAQPGKLGGYCIFDSQDRLNVVTQVWDGIEQYPAEIWHYQDGRDESWARVHRYDPDRVLAPAEEDDAFVCRPSVAENADGDLFVAWMNYDSVNVEHSTQIARADVMIAHSEDDGVSWSRAFRATGPDSTSRISPCLAPIAGDSLVIVCVEDQTAGLHEKGHGPQTTNSVTVLRVPTADLPAIEERTSPMARHRPGLSLVPNPAKDRFFVAAPSVNTPATLTLWDTQGRRVQTLSTTVRQGAVIPASTLSSGVYLVRLDAGGLLLESRLVVAR